LQAVLAMMWILVHRTTWGRSLRAIGFAPEGARYAGISVKRNTGLAYILAGAIAGLVGASSFFLEHVLPIQHVLYGISSLMLIALGLYLADIWHGVTHLEGAGKGIWKTLQPYSKRYIPAQNIKQAFFLGSLWGLLPCGLVYSVLIAAIATGSAINGGLLMLAFGLGTLPTLLTMGMAAVRLKTVLQNIWVRRASGLLVLGFGLVGLLRLI
jgi:sulfite exporter TauE/SafE